MILLKAILVQNCGEFTIHKIHANALHQDSVLELMYDCCVKEKVWIIKTQTMIYLRECGGMSHLGAPFCEERAICMLTCLQGRALNNVHIAFCEFITDPYNQLFSQTKIKVRQIFIAAGTGKPTVNHVRSSQDGARTNKQHCLMSISHSL